MRRLLPVAVGLAALSLVGCQGQVFRLLSNQHALFEVSSTDSAVERGHHYFYYPALEIYYCTEHGDWGIREDEGWKTVKSLPSRIVVTSSSAFVEISVVGPAPWRYFNEHRRQYPRGWMPPPNKKLPIGKVRIGG